MVARIARHGMVLNARKKLTIELPAVDDTKQTFLAAAHVKVEKLKFNLVVWLGNEV